MKRSKKVIALLLSSLMIFSVSACGQSKNTISSNSKDSATTNTEGEATEDKADTNTDKLKVGVCIYKYDDTYMSSVRQAIENVAKDASNVELIMNDSKNDQGAQNDQIDVMIEKGVNALAINVVDIGAASTVIEKAKEANLPIVFFNREPDAEVIKTYDKARFIGTKPEQAGIIQGELVADLWGKGSMDKNGDGKLQYVMLIGDPDNPEAIARTKYSVDTVVEKGIEVDKLGDSVANWDADKANTAMSAWLSRDGDKIEAVFANNDGMASGAIAALQAEGYNTGDAAKYIPVFGVDATDEAVDLINKGYMSGTVKQDAVGMGSAVFKIVENTAEGKDFLDGTDYTYDESGVAVRIPYQAYTGK